MLSANVLRTASYYAELLMLCLMLLLWLIGAIICFLLTCRWYRIPRILRHPAQDARWRRTKPNGAILTAPWSLTEPSCDGWLLSLSGVFLHPATSFCFRSAFLACPVARPAAAPAACSGGAPAAAPGGAPAAAPVAAPATCSGGAPAAAPAACPGGAPATCPGGAL